jgi:PTS system mannose-specific IIA component
MLIKFAACRGDGSLRKVAETLRDYGRRHITLAGEVLAKPVART